MKRALFRSVPVCAVLLCLILLYDPGLSAESLWRDSHLFSTRREIRAGDILKINFAYRNLLRYRNEMKVGETDSASIGQPGMKVFAFLPSLENNATYNRNNNLEYNSEREFSMHIAVTVSTVGTNGIIGFRGGHTVLLNGQSEQVTIGGEVRDADIREGNLIRSTDVANLSFVWNGPRVRRQEALGANDLATNAAPGSEGPELTPEAKERLLLFHLNRAHDILFRE
ncbi:MAG: flagellar basal body L-ring protein FlgH [Spirochaetota bacterium]|jgi:flagellar basal body L-ring protein FlgH|nr:flagellar basal body L-ring protein FlgH [Spirochaetota bacterium]